MPHGEERSADDIEIPDEKDLHSLEDVESAFESMGDEEFLEARSETSFDTIDRVSWTQQSIAFSWKNTNFSKGHRITVGVWNPSPSSKIIFAGYQVLRKLLEGKDYFLITTNPDAYLYQHITVGVWNPSPSSKIIIFLFIVFWSHVW